MYEPEPGDKKGGVIRQSKRVIWSCEYIYIYTSFTLYMLLWMYGKIIPYSVYM